MQKISLIIISCLISVSVWAQSYPETVHRCLSEEVLEVLTHDRSAHVEQFERWMEKQLANGSQKRTTRISERETQYILPVVVHIIHKGEPLGQGANIPEEQVLSQLDVINRDFRRFNADTVQTPEVFKPVAADAGIEFVLAPFDPDGNFLSSPGINRIEITDKFWNFNNVLTDLIPEYIWDPSRYLNFWVIDFASGQDLGFGIYPISGLPGLEGGDISIIANNQLDGVVMDYRNFGVNPVDSAVFDIRPFFDLGRTTTHEIGHYLGLRHIWGDGDCNATDYVSDTPPAAGRLGNDGYGINGICTFPGPDSCPDDEFPDMFQNYMDYTTDLCMNLFTEGQVERMHVVLENSPNRRSLHANAPTEAKNLNIAPLADNILSLSWEQDNLDAEAFIIQRRDQKDPLFKTIGYTLAQNRFYIDTLFRSNTSTAYTYRVLSASQTGVSLPSASVQSVITGLDGEIPQQKVSLFPNPSSAQVEVQLMHTNHTPAPWRVYSLSGQLIKQGLLSAGNQQLILNLSDQANGFYFFEIWLNQKPIRKKIIKKG